jgi:hypothetical protein
MVVSKNDLSLMGSNPVERKASGKRTPKSSQSLNGCLATAVATDLELPRAGYPHFDLVAVLKF